jgi:hypothetical protein
MLTSKRFFKKFKKYYFNIFLNKKYFIKQPLTNSKKTHYKTPSQSEIHWQEK